MRGLLADADIEGYARALEAMCNSAAWGPLWRPLNVDFRYFADYGLKSNSPDSQVWGLCQREQLMLLTANRNSESDDSLEVTIRGQGTAESLPVLTIADVDRLRLDRDYATDIVAKLIEVVLDLDIVRGSGRLYLP